MNSNFENPFSLEGKRILITGASSGIGRCCAIELSALGAETILVGRRAEELEITKQALSAGKHQCEVFDLTCGSEIVPWLEAICSKTGRLDGLVHAAGVSLTMPVRATSHEMFRNIISTNLESAFFLAKAFRLRSVRSSSASIVLIGSVMSIVGQPGLAAYSASKGALVTLAKSLALEFANENIRVNVVAPGHVETAMSASVESSLPKNAVDTIKANHPLGIGQPRDVAYATAYLLSDAARWVTGITLVVDGGYTAS